MKIGETILKLREAKQMFQGFYAQGKFSYGPRN